MVMAFLSQDALRHHVASSTGDVAAAPAFRLPPIASKNPAEQQQHHLRKVPKPSRLPLPHSHHRVYAASQASPVGGTYYTGPGPGQAVGPPQQEKKLPSISNNTYTRLVIRVTQLHTQLDTLMLQTDGCMFLVMSFVCNPPYSIISTRA